MVDASQPHAGVRVVEYADSGIAAAYAGWLLARMGAQVTRLTTAAPLDAQSAATPVQLALEVLAEGKASRACPTGRDALAAVLAECDVFLCDTPSALVAQAGPLQGIGARLPRLVLGVASTFGIDGPYAAHAGGSLDAQALAAMAWALGEPGRAPLSLPPGILEHQAGAMLAAGCLLALNVRDDCGSGRVVDVALADVLASYVAGNCRFYVHHGLQWQRSGRRASGSGGAYPFMILPCKDGAVCVCGRTREEWQRLVAAMGSPAWAAEPRFQDLRAMGTQYPDEVDALVAPWFAAHTKAELEAMALANSLIVAPLRELGLALVTRTVAGQEPREAGVGVVRPLLLGIDNDKAVTIGERRPTGAARVGLSGLAATMQGDDERRLDGDNLGHVHEHAQVAGVGAKR